MSSLHDLLVQQHISCAGQACFSLSPKSTKLTLPTMRPTQLFRIEPQTTPIDYGSETIQEIIVCLSGLGGLTPQQWTRASSCSKRQARVVRKHADDAASLDMIPPIFTRLNTEEHHTSRNWTIEQRTFKVLESRACQSRCPA